jgi:hypothetical protein
LVSFRIISYQNQLYKNYYLFIVDSELKRFIIFKEENAVIKSIDQAAALKGLSRSGFLRQLIRENLKILEA